VAILKGDVKLVKSQVMDDVPEGGGAPTANEVVDGSSNAIFSDVSEADRAAGRVSARKVHVWVQSDDTDTYLGGNVIVAEPPNDPNVSVTIFSTGDTFDERDAAISRIEAYLSVGPNYSGYLYSNHIEGMAALAIIQRTDALPAIGSSLALTKREGFSDQLVQYVRVTAASVVLTTFTDSGGDYQRYVLTLTLSDPLRADFPGFDAARIDPTKSQLAAATKVSTVIVANASRYYGVVPLEETASIGEFTVKATSIFTQLVPSAQIETPIGDARTNQLLAGVVGSGTAIVQNMTLAFSTTQNMFIGGGIAPKSLSIVNGDVTLLDSGGRLMNAGTQVGAVDYENGIVSLLTNVFGTGSLTFVVTYQPAQAPQAVTQSQGFLVAIETRSNSYARTIEPPPVPGTLSVSYLVAGRWYTIADDGSGAIRGPDSSYGSGTVNATTGTVLVTLGALPDVGSQVIYQWVEPQAARASDQLVLDNDGNLYWPFNTSGEVSLEAGAKHIAPGALVMTWNDGTPRTVTDDGAGNLTGYGTGTVDYAKGVIRLSPTTLPAPGTTINVTVDSSVLQTASVSIASGVGDIGVTGIEPGSFEITVTGQLLGKYLTSAVFNWGDPALYRIVDDGAGVLNLLLLNSHIAVGTIDYAAGTFVLEPTTLIPLDLAINLTAWDNVYLRMDKPNWAIPVSTS
jgi:hypothetical protein